MAEKQQAPYPLRISPEVRQALDEAAERSGRSLNQEIAARLAESLVLGDPGMHIAGLENVVKALQEELARTQDQLAKALRNQQRAEERLEEALGHMKRSVRLPDDLFKSLVYDKDKAEIDDVANLEAIHLIRRSLKAGERLARLEKRLEEEKYRNERRIDLPPGLRRHLYAIAKVNERDLRDEVVARLQKSIDSESLQSILAALPTVNDAKHAAAESDVQALAPLLQRLERDLALAEVRTQEERLRVWITASAFKVLLQEAKEPDRVLGGPLEGGTVGTWRTLVDAFIKMSADAFSEIRVAGSKLEAAESRVRPVTAQLDLWAQWSDFSEVAATSQPDVVVHREDGTRTAIQLKSPAAPAAQHTADANQRLWTEKLEPLKSKAAKNEKAEEAEAVMLSRTSQREPLPSGKDIDAVLDSIARARGLPVSTEARLPQEAWHSDLQSVIASAEQVLVDGGSARTIEGLIDQFDQAERHSGLTQAMKNRVFDLRRRLQTQFAALVEKARQLVVLAASEAPQSDTSDEKEGQVRTRKAAPKK